MLTQEKQKQKEPVWKIEVFGSLTASTGKRTISKFRTQKTALLLAYLACQPHRAHRRDQLVELLWPEEEDPAFHRLSVTLHFLRMAFSSPETSEPLFLSDRNTVRLNPTLIHTDKSRFESHLRDAEEAEDAETRIAHLKKAVDLYRGDLLPEYHYEWIEEERRYLSDLYIAALHQLAKHYAGLHQYETALDYTRRTLHVDPFNETTHQALMKLYIAARRPRAALRQYQELATLLRRESQTLPAEATTKMAQEITAKAIGSLHAESLLLAESPSFGNSPFGAASRRTMLGTWPMPNKRFFGREEDIRKARELLDIPEKRLLTLTGPPGCGKTHLAVAVAQKMHEEFGDTVIFVPLAHITDAQDIPDAIVEAARLRRDLDTGSLEEVIAFLSQGPSLLVLDNIEHLLDDASAVIWALLNLVPSLTCLVTSRQLLYLSAEQEYVVHPLPIPMQEGSPERLMEFPSVQLFVDRARNAMPEFRLDKKNAGTIAALCERMDGLPLAIELAAAWTKFMTPAEILQAQIAQITSRHKDVPERHASLHAALDWSYDLLTAGGRKFFARLSAFRRGWELEAATEVCDEPRALQYLTHLRERSLIEADLSGPNARYTLLETVREYAAEQMTDLDRRRQSARHALYFVRLAEEAAPRLKNGGAPAWLERLHAEHDNFRAALHFSIEEGNAELALRMATALHRFWMIRGYPTEGVSWLKKALESAPNADLSLRARALNAAGNLAYASGELEQAQQYFDRSLAIRRTLNDEQGVASSLGSLGMVACFLRDYENSRRLLEQSLAIFTQIGDAAGIAATQGNLALTLAHLGDYPKARSLYESCQDVFRASEDFVNEAAALNNMASMHLQTGDYSQAKSCLNEALHLGERLRSAETMAQKLLGYANLANRLQQPQKAARFLGMFQRTQEAVAGGSRAQSMEEYRRAYDDLKAELGDAVFQTAWREGYALPLTQAVAEADAFD